MNYHEDNNITKNNIKLINYLPNIGIKKVREEIITGLKASPKYISSKFFYDEKGSMLFEKITKLDEYYPTRTEKKLLSTIVKDVNLDFSDLAIIDLESEYILEVKDIQSRSKNSPFIGKPMKGRNGLTIIGGRIVWKSDAVDFSG